MLWGWQSLRAVLTSIFLLPGKQVFTAFFSESLSYDNNCNSVPCFSSHSISQPNFQPKETILNILVHVQHWTKPVSPRMRKLLHIRYFEISSTYDYCAFSVCWLRKCVMKKNKNSVTVQFLFKGWGSQRTFVEGARFGGMCYY